LIQQAGRIRRLGLRLRLLPAVLVLAALAGCAGGKRVGGSQFMKSVNAVEPGTSMERVREKLGAPDEKHAGEGPPRPAPPVGSPEGVLVTVPPRVEYQQWVYRRGDSVYHVFFTPTLEKPGKWQVLAVRSAPADKP